MDEPSGSEKYVTVSRSTVRGRSYSVATKEGRGATTIVSELHSRSVSVTEGQGTTTVSTRKEPLDATKKE